jgi:hypothetical protein
MGENYIYRMGHHIKADKVFEAWNSGDLNQMLKAISIKTNPIDRHFLLQTIMEITYKRRKEPQMRKICREIAEKHISEFAALAPALKQDMGGELPRVSTFQHFATLLSEDGDYEYAIEICDIAINYGLRDGTQSGFEGRIDKIKKRRASQK